MLKQVLEQKQTEQTIRKADELLNFARAFHIFSDDELISLQKAVNNLKEPSKLDLLSDELESLIKLLSDDTYYKSDYYYKSILEKSKLESIFQRVLELSQSETCTNGRWLLEKATTLYSRGAYKLFNAEEKAILAKKLYGLNDLFVALRKVEFLLTDAHYLAVNPEYQTPENYSDKLKHLDEAKSETAKIVQKYVLQSSLPPSTDGAEEKKLTEEEPIIGLQSLLASYQSYADELKLQIEQAQQVALKEIAERKEIKELVIFLSSPFVVNGKVLSDDVIEKQIKPKLDLCTASFKVMGNLADPGFKAMNGTIAESELKANIEKELANFQKSTSVKVNDIKDLTPFFGLLNECLDQLNTLAESPYYLASVLPTKDVIALLEKTGSKQFEEFIAKLRADKLDEEISWEMISWKIHDNFFRLKFSEMLKLEEDLKKALAPLFKERSKPVEKPRVLSLLQNAFEKGTELLSKEQVYWKGGTLSWEAEKIATTMENLLKAKQLFILSIQQGLITPEEQQQLLLQMKNVQAQAASLCDRLLKEIKNEADQIEERYFGLEMVNAENYHTYVSHRLSEMSEWLKKLDKMLSFISLAKEPKAKLDKVLSVLHESKAITEDELKQDDKLQAALERFEEYLKTDNKPFIAMQEKIKSLSTAVAMFQKQGEEIVEAEKKADLERRRQQELERQKKEAKEEARTQTHDFTAGQLRALLDTNYRSISFLGKLFSESTIGYLKYRSDEMRAFNELANRPADSKISKDDVRRALGFTDQPGCLSFFRNTRRLSLFDGDTSVQNNNTSTDAIIIDLRSRFV